MSSVLEAPTPHPARHAALIRDWCERYSHGRRVLILLGFTGVGILLTDPVRAALRDVPGRWSHILLVAWLLAVCMTPLAEFLALKIGAVDWADRRRVHHRPTPRMGGVAVFTAMITALAVNGIPDPQTSMLLLCGAGLFALGVADDVVGVPARLRLLAQVALSLLLVGNGLALRVLPVDTWWGAMANGLLTVFWMVGITNAFSFLDDMDGLATGLAILKATLLGVIAFLTAQTHFGWVSVAMIGALIGFLPYNFRKNRPAEISLGASGSTVLGFLLAGLAVHGEWAVAHPLRNLAVPVLIFGVLLYDMIHSTVARIVRGDVRSFPQWLEYTGRDHLHHRFEALLHDKRNTVLLICLLAATLGLSALVIRNTSLAGSLFVIGQCCLILVVVTILGQAGRIGERRDVSEPEPREPA